MTLKSNAVRLLLLPALSILLTSCNSKYRIWVGKENEQKIFDLSYGAHKKQRMDVFLPAHYARETPVVLIVHGGSWKYGTKEHMLMIQNHLHQQDIPTVNINYRLVSNKQNIRYHHQLQDIASAITAFNGITERANLLPDNYIILGESAGGHLALLYGYKNPEQIRKIISMSSPTDFYTDDFLKSMYSIYASPTFEDVVGEKFNRKNLSEKFMEASPLANVSSVPTLIFQGDTDFMVNRKQGIKLDSVLTANNIPHKFIYMKNTGHTPRFFSKKKRDSIILPEITDWIKEN